MLRESSATLYAAELAKNAGTSVVLDLDFRTDQWYDFRAYGVAVRSALHCMDIIMGTEDEINAAMLTDPHAVQLSHFQVSDAWVIGNTAQHVCALLERGPRVAIVFKSLDQLQAVLVKPFHDLEEGGRVIA